ncbi:MAG TPA: acylphosphatase [Gemmatimonadaceae bacterium]|nr:acylphosphatase [Gemmatimonadaceae bacterium]
MTVHGRVQGVGYRWYAREAARTLGVDGWASNLPDGSVLVEAGGAAAAIEAFLDALRAGPPHASVTEVRRHPRSSGSPLPARFTILH